jgi:hypothetical protein
LNNHNILTLVDEETEKSYECVVMTDSRDATLKYIGRGWFEYIASKEFFVGSILLFNYTIESRRLYVTPVVFFD